MFLSGRNLPDVHVMPYADVSTYHILWSDVVLIESNALGYSLDTVEEKPRAARPKSETQVSRGREGGAQDRKARPRAPTRTSCRKAAKAAGKSAKPKAAKKTAKKSGRQEEGEVNNADSDHDNHHSDRHRADLGGVSGPW